MKKSVAVLLLLVMMFGLPGCGSETTSILEHSVETISVMEANEMTGIDGEVEPDEETAVVGESGEGKSNELLTLEPGTAFLVTKEEHLDSAGNVTFFKEYEYDKCGIITEEITGTESGFSKSIYSYNSFGNILTETAYLDNGDLYRWSEYSNDQWGNVERIYSVFFGENRRFSGSVGGYWYQTEYRYDGNIKSRDIYEYDKSFGPWKYSQGIKYDIGCVRQVKK